MVFDKKADLLALERVSDGMGGYTEQWTTVKTINCFLAPVSAELQIKQYGFITAKAMKVYTKEIIPEDREYRLSIDDKQYKFKQINKHKKVSVALMEMVT